MKTKRIYFLMICILVAHFLIYGCGTKTKNKSQESTEIKSDEKTKLEENKKYFDSIKTVLLEEAKREFSQISKENEKEEATKKTIIESKETVFDDYRPVGNTGKSIQDRTGRIIETRTIIQENSKLEKQKEVEIKKVEQERKTKDCLAVIKINETKLSILEKKLDSRIDKLEKQKVQEGFKIGFWGWFWIIIIAIILILYFFCRKWLLIQFPWLAIIFRRKR
jgi:predicted RND superfamily exporter protein